MINSVLGPYETLHESHGLKSRVAELEQSLSFYRQREVIFQKYLDAVSRVAGDDFFRQIVCLLAESLAVRYAYITMCNVSESPQAETLAVWMGSDFGQNFKYSVSHTPCEPVLRGKFCYFPNRIQNRFPLDAFLVDWKVESYAGMPIMDDNQNVIGHLAVLDEKPMKDEVFIKNMMHIFSLRVDSELHRLHISKNLLDQIHQYKKTEAELKKKKDELEKVNAIVSAINSELNIKDLLQTVLHHTRFIQGVDKTTAILFDKNTGTFRLTASTDSEISKELHIELTPEEAHRRYAVDNEEVYEDIFVVKSVKGRVAEEKVAHLGLPASILAMRIRIQGEVTGYLIFNNMSDPHAFDHQDIYLVALLKSHILSALIKIRMLEELTELNQRKNEFLGMAAHDLRNPLHCMAGYIHMLIQDIEQGRFKEQTAKADMENMKKSSERMGRMLDELLDIAAIESGNISFTPEPGNIRQILNECWELHKRHAQQKNISLTLDTATALPDVYFDRMRMVEVIDNLLSNAIKYTHAGGRVEVRFEVKPDCIETKVSDTGQGLDEQDLQNIFRGFKKLSARPTGGESSTGLGLLIVKKIIDKHGGTLKVESRKGEGSTFTFSLPLQNVA